MKKILVIKSFSTTLLFLEMIDRPERIRYFFKNALNAEKFNTKISSSLNIII